MTSAPQSSERSRESTGHNTEDVQKFAETKEYLEAKISELENELSKLKLMLNLVDSNLREKSFVPAISLRDQTSEASSATVKDVFPAKPVPKGSEKVSEKPSEVIHNPNQRQLRRTKDSMVLANALIEHDKVIIVPEKGVKLSQHTPPFESFFVNRILRGYQSRDEEDSKTGKLKAALVLQYNVQEAQGSITSVTVSNYRDSNRLNEILSTITWAFTRMLEKK